MTINKRIIIICFSLFSISVTAQSYNYLPKLRTNEVIISHKGYSLVYSEEHEQAIWVAYELTAEETKKEFKRTDKFIPDPMIATGSADVDDYKKSGFDRGHLAPAADMGWDSIVMMESFYFSNMSPQRAEFNRGIWADLEALVRVWAKENKALYITTGPVLRKGLPQIGHNGVSVPEYYYKVILDFTEPSIKAIGFIMKNEGSDLPVQSYAVSIDSVEKVTGLDFFEALPDRDEKGLESEVDIREWSWDIRKKKGR